MRFSLRWLPFVLVAIFASLAGPAFAASLDDAIAAYKKNDFAGGGRRCSRNWPRAATRKPSTISDISITSEKASPRTTLRR